ncbi:MAG: hypothetical protein LBS21_03665 [Clostridiales bacterium]|nr:hypothetical protein [Clostridiales bacterium]
MNTKAHNKTGVILTAVFGVLAAASIAFAVWCLFPLISSSSGEINSSTKLTLYEGPKTMEKSSHAKVSVNGREIFVYDAVINNARENRGDYDVSNLSVTPMTYFDFSGGPVLIDIEMINAEDMPEITSAAISPLSYGITPDVANRHATFTITEPGFYTVQFNGSGKKAVHIFANPQETDIPDRNDPNVIWVDPGEWNIENIALQSGQTLYVSGGAVVHGTISAQFASNITVRGRGIIDGSNWPSWGGQEAHVPIDFRYCTNVSTEGIIFHNSNAWVFNSFETERGSIENVKIISARPNGDGFTLQSCRDYTVQNCFVRSWDDSCVVKNYEGNSNNVTFRDIVIWTDLAQSCEIGYETNRGQKENSVISNILFEDITIINAFHKPAMSIHNSDDALVENVTYRNITVENAAMGMGDAVENRQLMDLTIAPSGWASTKTRGKIRNVLFENINVIAGTQEPNFRFAGYDTEYNIDGVKIVNLNIFGKRIKSLDELAISKKFADGITLE